MPLWVSPKNILFPAHNVSPEEWAIIVLKLQRSLHPHLVCMQHTSERYQHVLNSVGTRRSHRYIENIWKNKHIRIAEGKKVPGREKIPFWNWRLNTREEGGKTKAAALTTATRQMNRNIFFSCLPSFCVHIIFVSNFHCASFPCFSSLDISINFVHIHGAV